MKPVTIGNNVWVGINVTILPGSEIRDGAIIGAGATVAGIVEKGEVRVAPKAICLKVRDLKHYENLQKKRLFLDL